MTTEDRVMDWLDRHDRHITVALVGPVLLLALLIAGSGSVQF